MNISHANPREKVYVFFDVDDTLISVKSMLSFQDFWYQCHQDAEAEMSYRQDLLANMHEKACWKSLNRLYYRHFRGRSEQEVIKMGKLWFEAMQKDNTRFYHKAVVDTLAAHQKAGHEVVFVSGSFPALLQPIAEELQVTVILSTHMEVVNGYYTGEILPPQTIAEGKARAIGTFLAERQGNPERCYAYGDDWSDLPMLEMVGNPCVVTGGRGLVAHAKQLNWPIINPAL
ncbi:MAG TPA: HAD-IB family hydrolase [Cellvibrionaceae bacterium]